MKIIGFEEHYGLPAIYEAAKKANDPYLQVLETLKKGRFCQSREPVGTSTMGYTASAYPWRGVRPVSWAADHCGP
jgi:hypothetical protein